MHEGTLPWTALYHFATRKIVWQDEGPIDDFDKIIWINEVVMVGRHLLLFDKYP